MLLLFRAHSLIHALTLSTGQVRREAVEVGEAAEGGEAAKVAATGTGIGTTDESRNNVALEKQALGQCLFLPSTVPALPSTHSFCFCFHAGEGVADEADEADEEVGNARTGRCGSTTQPRMFGCTTSLKR